MDNIVFINGKITKEFTYDHSILDEKYYMAYVTIKRISGITDTIPLLASENVISIDEKYLGATVAIEGKIRSFNLRDNGKKHLRLYILADFLERSDIDEEENDIELEGYICKEPVYRITPRGKELSDIILAIPRNFGKSDYIPCVCWGYNARLASDLDVGTKIIINGRFQSREYNKIVNGERFSKTAYEVSINRLAM